MRRNLHGLKPALTNKGNTMWGAVDFLILYDRIYEFIQQYIEYGKSRLRTYLGPELAESYILTDDMAIPCTVQNIQGIKTTQYTPADFKIHSAHSTAYKRLPWLSMQYKHHDYTVDFSDWVSDIRSATQVSLLTLVRLGSQLRNIHLPEHDAIVKVITREGEEEEYVFYKQTALLKRIKPTPISDVEIQRRQTCPFDEGGLFF